MEDWLLWFLLAIALFVGEMFTAGFWLACLAVGAAVAGVVGLIPGLGFVPQGVAFGVIVLISKSIRLVQQAQTMMIERLGKYHKTLASGINFVLPVIDRPRSVDWH